MKPGPFSDVLVVDLTRVLAGPYCTMMLAELGARVIKIENPDRGDDSREFGPYHQGKSAYYQSLNREKESIALDLKDADDRELLLKMVERADVVVENFRPGTLERLGLGFAQLQERNPRIILASVSGFGQTGPWSERPAYDLIVQALGGLMSVTGPIEGPAYKAGTSIGDITGGLFTLAGVSSALYHRERTGVGLRVDVSMLDGQIAILEAAVMRYATTGQPPPRMGNCHPTISPFEPYETADRPLVIACGNDLLFRRLCAALGRSEWATDVRFVANRDRASHQPELKVLLESVLRTASAAHWQAILDEAGVPCTLINTVADVAELPHVKARQMIVTADGLQMPGNPIKFDAFADPPTRRPAPDLNQDGDRIRAEFS